MSNSLTTSLLGACVRITGHYHDIAYRLRQGIVVAVWLTEDQGPGLVLRILPIADDNSEQRLYAVNYSDVSLVVPVAKNI